MTATTHRATTSEASTGLLVRASAMPHMSPTAVAAVISSFEVGFGAAYGAVFTPRFFRHPARSARLQDEAPDVRVLGASYRNPTEMSVLAGVSTAVAKQTVSLLEFLCNWRAKRRLLDAQADRAEADADLARLEVEARRREVYGLTQVRVLPVSVETLELNRAALLNAQPNLPEQSVVDEWKRQTMELAVRAGLDPRNAQQAFDRVDVLHAIQLLAATGLSVQVVTPDEASRWEPPR